LEEITMALNIENIIAEIKEASILELNDLVKAIEEEFGVTAAAPVAVAAAGAADAGVIKEGVPTAEAEEIKAKLEEAGASVTLK